MEGRPKRVGKTSLKGTSGPAKRSGCRGHDPMSPLLPCSAVTHSGEAAGIVTSKNALRERTRVESLRRAYMELQGAIPSVPPNTKLSKLLQEDDLRAIHDSNNNNTTTAAKHTGFEQPIHHSKVEPTARGPQKGLLHPVKKWPMRARLYPGVVSSETALLMGEQPPAVRHLRSKLSTLSANTTPYTLAAQLRAPTLQHAPTFDNNSAASAGMPSEDGSTSLFSDSTTVVSGGLSGGHTCLPPPYHANYLGSWEAEGPWVHDAVASDLSACHQPWATYTGCWSSWQD
ncbi:uncharacterized protein LOC127006479 isoform X2 [Eriocheir sinensis]|uniref:uncharacterized protein LOC127006479 isoform X2 n=1 Tax=Eriocheir sinensis TaxID=95602 RepID=UPI0021C77651|nr:uncharacterized protein LOC127006479 isoform X2 [Eriocheir sinensis]